MEQVPGVCPAAQAGGGAEASLWGAGEAECKVRAEPRGAPLAPATCMLSFFQQRFSAHLPHATYVSPKEKSLR